MNDKAGVPHSGKYVAYYRVSTQKQGASGLGLEAQKDLVQRHLNGGDWELIAEFTETESGKRSDRKRPELRKALELVEQEGATLIVAKLDRLTRNFDFLTSLLTASRLIVCDIPQMGNPSQNKFILRNMANVAEFEADMISERTKAALAASKARGTVLGSPSPEKGSVIGAAKVKADADEHAAEVMKVIEELQEFGCTTLQKIADGLNARGIETAREVQKGKRIDNAKWYPSSVRNVMKRSEKNG